MKRTLYIIAIAILCSIQSINIQAQVIRTWTGQGDGQSWNDAMNWNSVTCKYMNGDGEIIYQTGHVAPRSGEIVVFNNVGNLTLTGSQINIGNFPYTDYSEIINSCGYGGGPIYSLRILNSNINFVDTQVIVGGTATAISGYAEALKLQNSTLTCWEFASSYAAGGSSQPLNMNSIYAENSTITTTYFQSGFFPSGKTYFTGCTINTPFFSPYSNDEFPNETDEFVGCTINADNVNFGPECIAIATNCTFNLNAINGPTFSLNSFSTLNSVTLNNITLNIAQGATGQLFIPYKPGASLISGNINCNSMDPNFIINFANMSNINSFSIQVSGNIRLLNGGIFLANQGVLQLTGNLEMIGAPNPDLDKDVFINNDTVFQIGGISNYGAYNDGSYGPRPGERFGLKFSGSGDSHIIWPTGFPADTLTIEKTGCGKVYIDNGPLHITGKLHVKSGQLVLSPNAASNYALVDGADLMIETGGSVVVQPGADIAIAGNYVDHNTTIDSASCTGFINSPFNTVNFYNTEYSPVDRFIGSAGNTSIGNVAFINQDNNPFMLQNNFATTNFDFGNHGKVVLGNYDFTVNGLLTSYDSLRYFVTNGTGSLKLNNVGNSPVLFPVGSSSSSYTPATIINNGTPDDFRVRVLEGLLSSGDAGIPVTSKAVNKTWLIEETTPGGSDANITLQWNTNNELGNFNRNSAYLMHYANNDWDFGPIQPVSGNNPFQMTRANVTSFSPFSIGNIDAIPGNVKTLYLTVFLENLFNGTTMNKAQGTAGDQFSGTVADHISVEIHDFAPPFALVAGPYMVEMNTDGTAPVEVPAPLSANYYVVVKHRNSIETWSGTPLDFGMPAISYDFSTAISQAFGSNLKLLSGKFVFYGGDVNQDGVVDTADITPVDNDSAGYLSGYLDSDVNGDGIVDTGDMTIVDNNAAGYVGSATP